MPCRIAVISNHIPEELIKTKKILKKYNITLDLIGNGQNIYVDITPQILSKYDLIISIGKTVQYALGMGIPVYEYDYFGGNGYINKNNINEEAYYNFTGRPKCRRLSPQDIVHEIIDGYDEAVSNAFELKEIVCKRFLLSAQIDTLFEVIERSPDFSKEKIDDIRYNYKLDIVHGKAFYAWILGKNDVYVKERLALFLHFKDIMELFLLYLKKKIKKIVRF